MTSTVDIDTRLDEMPINDIKLVDCEISDALREQGVRPAVRAKLTDESKLAIKRLIREVAEEVIGQNEHRIPSETNNLQSKKRRIRNAIKDEQRTKLNKILGNESK